MWKRGHQSSGHCLLLTILCSKPFFLLFLLSPFAFSLWLSASRIPLLLLLLHSVLLSYKCAELVSELKQLAFRGYGSQVTVFVGNGRKIILQCCSSPRKRDFCHSTAQLIKEEPVLRIMSEVITTTHLKCQDIVESAVKATAHRKCGDSMVSITSIHSILKMYGVHRISSTCKMRTLVIGQMRSAKLKTLDNGVNVKKTHHHWVEKASELYKQLREIILNLLDFLLK